MNGLQQAVGTDGGGMMLSLDEWLLHRSAVLMLQATRLRRIWPARSRKLVAEAKEYARRSIEAAKMRRALDEITESSRQEVRRCHVCFSRTRATPR